METRLTIAFYSPTAVHKQYTNMQNKMDTEVPLPHLGRLGIGLNLEPGLQLNNREQIL